MTIAQGLSALLAAPLAATAAAAALTGQIAAVGDYAAQRFDAGRRLAVRTLHLDHAPAPLGPYAPGEILLYQRLDDSVRSRAIFEDDQGSVYAQDEATGRLRILPVRRYLRPADLYAPPDDDWMSADRYGEMHGLPVYLRLK